MLTLILLIFALVCFVAEAFNLIGKINLVALGLALWVLTVLLNHAS